MLQHYINYMAICFCACVLFNIVSKIYPYCCETMVLNHKPYSRGSVCQVQPLNPTCQEKKGKERRFIKQHRHATGRGKVSTLALLPQTWPLGLNRGRIGAGGEKYIQSNNLRKSEAWPVITSVLVLGRVLEKLLLLLSLEGIIVFPWDHYSCSKVQSHHYR
jgi:hypothetical protein